MQDQSIAAKPHWLVMLLVAFTFAIVGVGAISIVADDQGDTGCGGG